MNTRLTLVQMVFFFCLLLFFVHASIEIGYGQEKEGRDTKGKSSSLLKQDSVDVRDALAFIRQHHEEILPLLEVLKAMNPKQFESVIKETNRLRSRLDLLRTRDEEAYGLELDAWKIQSQINLHVARKVANASEFDSDQALIDLLEKQRSIQVKLLEGEKLKTEKRLAQVNEQLDQAKEHSSEWLSSQLSKLSRKAALQGTKSKRKASPQENQGDKK